MARTVASLPAGSRITDYISLDVVAKFFPREKVATVLEETGRASGSLQVMGRSLWQAPSPCDSQRAPSF